MENKEVMGDLPSGESYFLQSLTDVMKELQDVHLERCLAESPQIYEMLNEKEEAGNNQIADDKTQKCVNGDECLLLDLPSEVREKIWKKIPSKIMTCTIRKVCRKLLDDADYLVGIYTVLDDRLSELMEWLSEVAIQSLRIKFAVKPLDRWYSKTNRDGQQPQALKTYLAYPHLLKQIKIEGKISVNNLHEILKSCKNLENLTVRRGYRYSVDDYAFDYIGTLKSLVQKSGSLEKYPCFQNLRKIDMKVANEMSYKYNSRFLDDFVLPLLEHYYIFDKLHSFTLVVRSDKKYNKIILEGLVELLQTKQRMKCLNLKLMQPSFLLDNPLYQGDNDNIREIDKVNESSKNVISPQLDELSLEVAELETFRDWLSLIESQCHLTYLKSGLGALFWKYYYLPVTNCSKHLTKICLRDLKTLNIIDGKSYPLNLEMFSDCERLISLNLSGFHVHNGFNSECTVKNIRKLPQRIKYITLEAFKIEPSSLRELHQHLVNMEQLNLLYWNRDCENLLNSIDVLKETMKTRAYILYILDWKTLTCTNPEKLSENLNIENLLNYTKRNSDCPLIVECSLSTALTFGINITAA